jgi:hypothetical protein
VRLHILQPPSGSKRVFNSLSALMELKHGCLQQQWDNHRVQVHHAPSGTLLQQHTEPWQSKSSPQPRMRCDPAHWPPKAPIITPCAWHARRGTRQCERPRRGRGGGGREGSRYHCTCASSSSLLRNKAASSNSRLVYEPGAAACFRANSTRSRWDKPPSSPQQVRLRR